MVQSTTETSTKFLSSCPPRWFTPEGDVSCAKPGGQSGRSCVRSQDTGTVWLLYACGSVSSARRSEQTSTCSLPTCTYRVSHLHVQRGKREDDQWEDWKRLYIFIKTENLLLVCQSGFSPVCVLRCAFRCELLVYTLLQPVKSHRWIRRFFRESGESGGRGCFVPEWTITDGLLPLWETQRGKKKCSRQLLLLFAWLDQQRVLSSCNRRLLHEFQVLMQV